MYSNQTKPYYTTLPSTGNNGNGGLSTIGIAFIDEANKLLLYYNSNNLPLFFNEYNNGYHVFARKR